MADQVLVIRYETEDGELYYQRQPFDSTGEELKLQADDVKAKAAERGTPVVQTQTLQISKEEYEQIRATTSSYELFAKR